MEESALILGMIKGRWKIWKQSKEEEECCLRGMGTIFPLKNDHHNLGHFVQQKEKHIWDEPI